VQGGNKARPMIVCANKECGYKRAPEAEGQPAPAGPPPLDPVRLSSAPPGP
jgi:hypothetical protein